MVSLGTLEPGTYKIYVNPRATRANLEAALVVEESKVKSVDSFTYADVEYVQKGAEETELVFRGYHPSDCYELKEIKTLFNGLDTFSILPHCEGPGSAL